MDNSATNGAIIAAAKRAVPQLESDRDLRVKFKAHPLQVLEDFGAPVAELRPAIRSDLENYLRNVDFYASASSCWVCEITVGGAIILIGGAAVVVAAAAIAITAPEAPIIIAIAAAVGLESATVAGILGTLASAAVGGAFTMLGLFISAICEALGSCDSSDSPTDPAISNWIGDVQIDVGAGSSQTQLRTNMIPSAAVSSATLYLSYVNQTDNALHLAQISPSDVPTSWSDALVGSQATTPQSAPSIACFNGSVYVLYVTGGGIIVQSFSGSWSSPVTVLSSGANPHVGLSATVFNNKLFVIYASSENELYFTSSADGINWSAGSSILPTKNPLKTAEAPASTVFNNRLYVIYTNKEDDHKIYFTSYNGTLWTASAKVKIQGGGSVQSEIGLSATTFDGKLYLFHRSEHHNYLYWITYDGAKWVGNVKILVPDLTESDKGGKMTLTTTVGFSTASMPPPASATGPDGEYTGRLFLIYVSNVDGTLHATLE
jgi:hypothetical protein